MISAPRMAIPGLVARCNWLFNHVVVIRSEELTWLDLAGAVKIELTFSLRSEILLIMSLIVLYAA